MRNTKDALDNEIVFGNTYGYMTESNGHVTIVVGVAVKKTDAGNITISPEYKTGAYSNGKRRSESCNRSTAVKPIKLFPVSLSDYTNLTK